jgi:predicted nucleotidyltransferase
MAWRTNHNPDGGLSVESIFKMKEPRRSGTDATHASVLQKFKCDLASAFPGRLRRVVLFGSRARGDHRNDSDWDVAIFLDDYDRLEDLSRLVEVAHPYLLEGIGIRPIGLSGDGKGSGTELLRALRTEGVTV